LIDWSRVELKSGNLNECVLGKGSFGTVIRALLRVPKTEATEEQTVEVAVKVLTTATAHLTMEDRFNVICRKACKEVAVMAHAEKEMIAKHCIVHIHGVAQGRLPPDFLRIFSLDKSAIGIVMNYASGGSLDKFVAKSENPDLSLV